MSDESFIDTNALIHAHDIDATTRHQIARAALRERRSKRTGVLSMQWLEESCANVTRNVPIPPSKDLARLELSRYAIWCIEDSGAGQQIAGMLIENPFVGVL